MGNCSQWCLHGVYISHEFSYDAAARGGADFAPKSCELTRLMNANTSSSESRNVSGCFAAQRSAESREAKKKWKWQAEALIRAAEVASHIAGRRMDPMTAVGSTVSMRAGDTVRPTHWPRSGSRVSISAVSPRSSGYHKVSGAHHAHNLRLLSVSW